MRRKDTRDRKAKRNKGIGEEEKESWKAGKGRKLTRQGGEQERMGRKEKGKESGNGTVVRNMRKEEGKRGRKQKLRDHGRG